MPAELGGIEAAPGLPALSLLSDARASQFVGLVLFAVIPSDKRVRNLCHVAWGLCSVEREVFP